MCRQRAGSDRMDRIAPYFFREWRVLLPVTVCGLLYNVGLALGPYLEGRLVQGLYETGKNGGGAVRMLAPAVFYVIVIFLVQLFRFGKRFYVRRFCNNVNRRMKGVLFRGLLLSSLEESSGDMMTRAVADVDACAEGMRKVTTEVFDTGVALIAYLCLLFYYDWRLTLVVCLILPVAYILADRLKGRVTAAGRAAKVSAGKLNGAVLDRVQGEMLWRVRGCEEERNRLLEEQLEDYEKKAVRSGLLATVMPPVYQTVSMLGVIPILFFGAKNVAVGSNIAWDIGVFTAYLTCFSRLAIKSAKAAKLFNAIQNAKVSFRRILPFLQAPGELPPQPKPLDGEEFQVQHLSFAYDAEKPILTDVSFSARPGEWIAVCGGVASGKTTLAKLLLTAQAYGGSIRFGGEELHRISSETRRSMFGYVGHESFLMGGTIADNVMLGSAGDPMEYLRAVQLADEVGQMPGGVNASLGSDGSGVSGGQAQRIALARCLAHPRPIVILDDPFSGVDRKTEKQLLRQIRPYLKNSVVLFLSHRLYTAAGCDRVLWLQDGQGVARSHTEQLRVNAAYADGYALQTGTAVPAEGGIEHEEAHF